MEGRDAREMRGGRSMSEMSEMSEMSDDESSSDFEREAYGFMQHNPSLEELEHYQWLEWKIEEYRAREPVRETRRLLRRLRAEGAPQYEIMEIERRLELQEKLHRAYLKRRRKLGPPRLDPIIQFDDNGERQTGRTLPFERTRRAQEQRRLQQHSDSDRTLDERETDDDELMDDGGHGRSLPAYSPRDSAYSPRDSARGRPRRRRYAPVVTMPPGADQEDEKEGDEPYDSDMEVVDPPPRPKALLATDQRLATEQQRRRYFSYLNALERNGGIPLQGGGLLVTLRNGRTIVLSPADVRAIRALQTGRGGSRRRRV